MKKRLYNIAIVGATGLVGTNFIRVMEEMKIPVGELRLLASPKSEGKTISAFGCECTVHTLTESSFEGIDFALFSAGGSVSRQYAKIAVSSGAIVIDNSSAWRMDASVPLVVPEINFEDIQNQGIIANPNCSTIQSVLPLKALRDAFGLESVYYSTYQAVSGSGQKGIDDLNRTLAGETPEFYPYDISKTCIPEIDVFTENGYTLEEMKMVNETKKILHDDSIEISATCIRVPVEVGHGVLINALLKQDVDLSLIKQVLSSFEGIKVVDDLKNHGYPTSLLAKGNDFVYVGRIRKDLNNPFRVLFYTVADNVRKGAASNAVQILKRLIDKVGENND